MNVEQLSTKLNEPEWMLDARKKAVIDSQKLTMPNFKYGITIRLHADENAFNIPKPEDIDTTALTIDCPLPTEKNKTLEYNDRLSAVHSALLGKTIVIRVPQNFAYEKPITITNKMKKNACFDSIKIIAEPFSRAVFIENNDSCTVRFTRIRIEAEEGAKITYGSTHKTGVLWARREAFAGKNSQINWCDITSSSLAYSRTNTILNGDHSETNYTGIFTGNEGQHDISVTNRHIGRNTKSDMLSKGTLSGNAKAISQGTIIIEENAFNSDGYQKEDILIQDDAEADAIPQLFINNNDVKCTHGATVSNTNPEQLFYLTSRGIEENDAKKMLAEGFLFTALNRMPREMK